MTESWQGNRHRVFIPQALGADEFLRATWHESDRVIVFSHWSGNSCVAATPVRIADTPELAELLVTAVGHEIAHPELAVMEPVRQSRPSWRTKVGRLLHRTGPTTPISC
ncbi:MAG TPA: hypothetical protein VFV63_19760 [Ilumatobacteraceae bacterium]|nr:hypothetical protein [Ilumatobacteraceae bacterium]